MDDKIVFVAPGPITFASARLRAFWLEPYLDCIIAEPDDQGRFEIPSDARAYVFSKALNHDGMRHLRDNGALIFWDCCDPVWWFGDHSETVKTIHAATFSNDALRSDFVRTFPGVKTYTIPDRLELSHYDQQREHKERSFLRLIWFGLWYNRFPIYGALSALERARKMFNFDFSLTICDDRPDKPLEYETDVPITYQRWKLDEEARTLAAHDLAILPPYPPPWGELKSNNKTLSAWAAGLPVTKCYQFERFLALMRNSELRESEKRHNLKVLKEHFDIRKSAEQWREILDEHS